MHIVAVDHALTGLVLATGEHDLCFLAELVVLKCQHKETAEGSTAHLDLLKRAYHEGVPADWPTTYKNIVKILAGRFPMRMFVYKLCVNEECRLPFRNEHASHVAARGTCPSCSKLQPMFGQGVTMGNHTMAKFVQYIHGSRTLARYLSSVKWSPYFGLQNKHEASMLSKSAPVNKCVCHCSDHKHLRDRVADVARLADLADGSALPAFIAEHNVNLDRDIIL